MYTWNRRDKRWTRRKKFEAIVQVNPTQWYNGLKKNSTLPEDGITTPAFAIAAQRALVLYVPFKDISILSDPNLFEHPNAEVEPYDFDAAADVNFKKWSTCFLHHFHHSPNLFPAQIHQLVHGLTAADFDIQFDPNDLDDSEEEWDPSPPITQRAEQEWERLARITNDHSIGQPREFLGNRDIDVQHDWSLKVQQFTLPPDPQMFIAREKRLAGEDDDEQQDPVLRHMLNDGQQQVYDYLIDGFQQKLNEIPAETALLPPLHTITMGTAGVGKSFLIRALEHEIWELAKAKYGNEAYPNIRTVVKLVAFIDKAAYQVSGVTIHSLLSIGDLRSGVQPLSQPTLRHLQKKLKGTRFLFIDEMSMVGLKMLYAIDFRLKEIFPSQRTQPFGGVSVVLFGDFGQLPPVLDNSLYAKPSETSPPWLYTSSKLYRDNFKRAFELTQQMRQQGQDEMEQRFRTALSNLRVGAITLQDWQFFQSRSLSHMSPAEQQEFGDSIYLFARNVDVKEKNISMLETGAKPVARINAQYQGVTDVEGSKIDSDLCGNLEHSILLSVNSRVCFTSIKANSR